MDSHISKIEWNVTYVTSKVRLFSTVQTLYLPPYRQWFPSLFYSITARYQKNKKTVLSIYCMSSNINFYTYKYII